MNQTFEKLIKISIQQFSKKGYYGASLNSIAQELGVKKPSLYNYIENKDELYLICIDKCINEVLNIIREIDLNLNKLQLDFFDVFLKHYLCSEYLTKFYIQLSFAPKHLMPKVMECTKELSKELDKKLIEVYEHNQLKINQNNYLTMIKMFINSWIYKRSLTNAKLFKIYHEESYYYQTNIILNQILA